MTDYTALSDADLCAGLQRETARACARQPFNAEFLRESMARRPHRATYDDLTPGHSHLLNIALWDALPQEARAGRIPNVPVPVPAASSSSEDDATISQFYLPSSPQDLPSGHHLVYFPLQRPIALLEPDGTDPAQSPGVPFVRRMWAGGALHFWRPQQLRLDGRRAVCVERLDTANLAVRGGPGCEKVFVDVVRRYGCVEGGGMGGNGAANDGVTDPETRLALENRVWADADLEERRTLVFLRARDGEEAGPAADERIIKCK